MAKIKNKKRKIADHVHQKKEAKHAKKPLNPFEMHVNKEKMRVLGKKVKNDRGLPGIARTKALEKRKNTLLQEYKIKNKSNKFTDKRIGEKNHTMTDDDKIMARFTAVRVKQQNRKSIFNLADDEVLTHRGQTLNEIEKFDDPRSDDGLSDSDNETERKSSGRLEANFVADAHFGGGILRKTGIEGAKTHKELIDQLISESKKRKAEKQRTKEATLELTEKLDSDWKDLLPLVSKSKKSKSDEEVKSVVDDYDKAMRELKFEARGTVSDRLKDEDEVAKEEKERLEEMEQARMERMRGVVEDDRKGAAQAKHRSADDLDDDLVYESDQEYMLSYNQEGESNVHIQGELNGKVLNEVEGGLGEDEEENGEEGSESEENEESEESESEEDNLSDLKEDDSESDTESAVLPTTETIKNSESELTETQIKADLLKRKEIMEKAREELPFTFTLPDSYESLQATFANYSSEHQAVIVERMIKCNHPSLAEENKNNLALLFAYLLQHLNDVASDVTDTTSMANCFDIFKALVPQIYELAQLNEKNAHISLVEVIKEKHLEYRKKHKTQPGFEVLIFFKLVSLLFTTSDFRHQVVTPCVVFMEQILNKCRVNDYCQISYGLFVTTLILEYTTLSKRYMPSSISFLAGLLHMAIPKGGVKLIKVLPPFKPIANHLVLQNDCSANELKFKLSCSDLIGAEAENDDYKIRVIFIALKLLDEFVDNLKTLSNSVEIFAPVLKYLLLLPICKYPIKVRTTYENLVAKIKELESGRSLVGLVVEAEKPKALRLYEPKIVEVFDYKTHKVQSREKSARDKMLHRIKREKKGALREIRRDKSFLGSVKIHQQIKSDMERKEKVKRIYSEAAVQQCEYNAFDRKKKKK